MPKHNDAILVSILASAFALLILPSWPMALALCALASLYFGIQFLDRSRRDQLEEFELRIKHVEEKMAGLMLTRSLGRG